jgi:hypothetical protein
MTLAPLESKRFKPSDHSMGRPSIMHDGLREAWAGICEDFQ